MIRAITITMLRKSFPTFDQGIADYQTGKWSEIAEHSGSYAYEIGRLFAQEAPKTDPLMGSGFVTLSPYLEAAIRDLM